MKFKAAILAVGLVAMTACGASASSSGTFSIGPTAGMSLPTGNYGDAASTGWHGGVTCDYNMNNGWGFGATAAYHSWGGSDAANTAWQAFSGDPEAKTSWSAIQFTPQASYHFHTSSSVKPYATLGTGLYNVKLKLNSTSGDETTSDSRFGYNFGGGMDFASHGSTTWGINTAYHIVSMPNGASSINNLTVGLHMQFGLGGH